MLLRADGPHLTYCSNIHPGESWAQTRAAVLEHVPEVRRRVAPSQRFGVGLRLSNEAVTELGRGDALASFRAELEARELYVFSINGFPYGPFHGTTVKESVYRPDWRETQRELYTQRLADALEALLPEGMTGSISTVPLCFAERNVAGASERMAEALRRQAAELSYRHRTRGVELVLALEPEPCCALETIDQTIAFFREHLLSRESIKRFGALTQLDDTEAEAALRRHLGVCLDTCHAAVEFEDPRASVAELLDAGIRIGKVQVTTGIRIRNVDRPHVEALRAFADDVYLHQVVAKGPDGLHRVVDLPPALQAFADGRIPTDEWRVHFHVPVFMRELPPFENTQEFLAEALDEVLQRNATEHLELETYTWDVLPPEHRKQSVDEAISGELLWVVARAR